MSKNFAAKDSGSRKYVRSNLTTTKVDDDSSTRSTQYTDKKLQLKIDDDQDNRFGYARYTDGPTRTAYMYNMYSTSIYDDNSLEHSAIDMYYIQHDGSTFKACIIYEPYFLIQINGTHSTTINECESFLIKQYSEYIVRIEHIDKINLSLNNHLIGITQLYLKLLFHNEDSMKYVRKQLMPVIEQNKLDETKNQLHHNTNDHMNQRKKRRDEILYNIIDIREYDISYEQRVAIDLDLRCGMWYDITPQAGEQSCNIVKRADILDKPTLKVCAWDIETSKEPLKFPDAQNDPIIMISYMIDTNGYLLVNRSIVSADIDSFQYNPKPGEYDGSFDVINCSSELDMLQYFFKHIRDEHIHIMSTYNGDYFDFPYVEQRALKYNMQLKHEIGMWKKAGTGTGKGKASNKQENEYCGRFTVHLDCKHWVDRDSYLPQGSRGLKSVTKYKLKYEPVEMDYEDIVPWAIERPQELATYSVSDAVATYYLYDTYVHNFIFSLCSIIPSNPNDVLRFGSGTLCELLLMVQAYQSNIVCPNKQSAEHTTFYKGHVLDSETYIGGFVEACESGIFRSDLPTEFYCNPQRTQSLIDNIDTVMKFVLQHELHTDLCDVTNYDDIKQSIITSLQQLLHKPKQTVKPLIYHLDVGAMYPNIILTNRLQPMAIVNESICASCDYNRPGNNCQRSMSWKWRGRYLPATRSEYELIKQQIEVEANQVADDTSGIIKSFTQLSMKQQSDIIKKRVKQYGQTVYKKQIIESEESRDSTICQRENSFYVDTVRAFRDRRYDYKSLSKQAKQQLDRATSELDISKAKDLCLLYDSLQLAHKCILNSFYGYVMRKGARWYSMDMAGIVTLTGAQLIQDATAIVRDIGRPLELDTDGIWCILPSTFPDSYSFINSTGKKLNFNYPCALLNNMVHEKYTNTQYQTLQHDPLTNKSEYITQSQCSIYFELDGPYRAMILPSGLEDGQMIKKRYAVFNHDGTLAELKGFELKRRGELQIIKTLQEDLFHNGAYLQGDSLHEAYSAVGERANHWLDLLHNKGYDLEDIDLFNQIGESKNLSDELQSYGDRKLVSITALRRLGEFLGENSISGKNLSIRYVIVKYPIDTDVSQRAVPIKIFDSGDTIKKLYLNKWCSTSQLHSYDVRDLLDWNYYIDRFNKAIQKIITIPAAFQHIDNPVSRCVHPEWLKKKLSDKNSAHQQQKLNNYFVTLPSNNSKPIDDIESIGVNPLHHSKLPYQPVKPLYITDESNHTMSVGVTTQSNNDTHKLIDPLSLVTSDPSIDHPSWVQQQKLLWKQLKSNRHRADTIANQTEFGGFNMTNGQISNKRLKSSSMQSITIEIVSIEQHLTKSNYYNIYGILNRSGHITQLQYKHNKMFYLNCYDTNTSFLNKQQYFTYKKCGNQYILPYNKPLHTLYECQLTDEYCNYDINQYVIKNYTLIENVYQHNVDPVQLFIIQFGHTVQLVNNNIINYNKHTYTATDLKSIEHQSTHYLTEYMKSSQHNIIHIYELVSKQFGILCIYNQSTQQCSIFTLNTAEQNNTVEQTLWNTHTTQMDGFDDIQFNVSHYKSRNSLVKDMKSTLGSLLNDCTMVVLNTDHIRYNQLMNELTVLYSQPKLIVQHQSNRTRHIADIFNSINWYESCLVDYYTSLHSMNDYVTQQLIYSRYARIPLCQSNNSINQINDVLFARQLQSNHYILWNSKLDTAINDNHYYIHKQGLQVKSIQPNLYRCICMEFTLDNLLINAVENYTLLYELYEKLNTNDIGLLKIMKYLIHYYVIQTTEKQCALSERLVNNVYTWYQYSTQYYDITLYNKVNELLTMCMNQLTLQLEKLGSTVINISMKQLIIATNRYAENHCIAYIKTILNSITNKDKFFWISITANKMYSNLLYIDTQNYGGVLVPGQLDEPDVIDTDMNAAHEMNNDIVAQWNIASYLPYHAQQYFILTITEFMLQPNQYLQNDILNVQNDKPQRPDEQIDQLRVYLNDQVSTHYTRILMQRVKELQSEYPSNERLIDVQSELFPKRAGTYLPLNNTALEFIKMICYCMNLDSLCCDSVNRMRDSLMKLVHVKSFSSHAAYQSPCITYILDNIQCTSCHTNTDLDLCRDSNLTDSVQYDENGKLLHDIEWLCPSCHAAYDIGTIELQLIQLVHGYTEQYQVQDLACKSCHRVKNNNLQQYCTCSGQYNTTYTAQDYHKQLQTFGNIAEYYQLHRLNDTIQFLQTH